MGEYYLDMIWGLWIWVLDRIDRNPIATDFILAAFYVGILLYGSYIIGQLLAVLFNQTKFVL